MLRRILFLFLGLTLAGASLAWGQPGHELGGGGFQDKFLEVKRTQLGPALGVNQQTVDKLLAIDARYKPLRHQMVTGMRSDMQRLQQLMSQSNPPEQEIRTLLTDMKRKRLEMLNLQQRKDDEESALLTPMQQARYLMYLMSLIKEARSVKSGAGTPAGQARPGIPGGPGGFGAPALRAPTEIPVSRPAQ
ncbi:MAG: Spy/CpxP family protein refolding chaperone [Desulfobaccales bacterium]